MRAAGCVLGACSVALASAGVAALLHATSHDTLAAAEVADPLPFLVLALGVIAAAALAILPAEAVPRSAPPPAWHNQFASRLEAAGRILVGAVQAHGDDQTCCQALHLLQTLFDAAAQEAGRGAADAVARCASLDSRNAPCSLAEHSASGLATKYEALVLQMATSARVDHPWASRSVTAVAEALDCVPAACSDAIAASSALPGRQRGPRVAATLAGVQLLVFPVYAAAAIESAWAAAGLALVAAAVPAGLGLLLLAPASASDEGDAQCQNECLTRRRRLFNLRIMELQSMAAANAPKALPAAATCGEKKSAGQGVGAAPKKGERNQVALNLELVSGQLPAAKEAEVLEGGYAEEDLYNEVPPFTMVGGADSKVIDSKKSAPVVMRAVPVRKDPLKDPATRGTMKHEAPTGSAGGPLAQVLGEIGMLDPIMSLGSALSLSTSSNSGTSEEAAPSVSTFEILSGATATPLPEPVTPDAHATRHQQQKKLPTSPDLTPIREKREEDWGAPPGQTRGTASVPESLPDVSQNELSQTSFSLSPGGTAHNTSGILPSPGIGLALQDDKRHEKHPLVPGFNAEGFQRKPVQIVPTIHERIAAPDMQHNPAMVARAIPQRPHPRPRAFC